MKNLKTFLNESVKKPKQELYQYVDVWIDEMYQEGLVDYDDEHIKKYAQGDLKPNYKDIVKGVMEEFKSDISSNLKIQLKNFLKEEKHTSAESKKIIYIIDIVIENFAASNEFPGY